MGGRRYLFIESWQTTNNNIPVLHHGLRDSASHVLMAACHWEIANFYSLGIDAPLIYPKCFFTGNYVGDPYSCAKFSANTFTMAFQPNGEI